MMLLCIHNPYYGSGNDQGCCYFVIIHNMVQVMINDVVILL